MTDQELLDLNAKGFIPGPNESEMVFRARVASVREIFGQTESIPRAHWDWTKHHLSELFSFEPESLVAFYSNANLTFWQGAACWIDETQIPQLQLREGFRKGRYLGLYSREETLSHEAVHAARAAFDEPENEEFFAYATSEKKWRRALGPILKRPWEAWLFMGTLVLNAFWQWGLFFASICLSLAMYRLARQHLRRYRACNTLLKLGKEKRIVRAILFRLTDREIRELAKGHMITGDDTLRWRLIRQIINPQKETGSA